MQVGSRRAVLNPVSGDGDHADPVERRLSARGFAVSRTQGPGDAFDLGRAARRAPRRSPSPAATARSTRSSVGWRGPDTSAT